MVKVLVVEDSCFQRKLIVRLLKDNHFKVKSFGNAKSALNQIDSWHPDLVLLDLILPDMSGYQVCREIKKSPHQKKPLVIICSSQTDLVSYYWAFKQGADAYLAKPFPRQELINTIDQLLLLIAKQEAVHPKLSNS